MRLFFKRRSDPVNQANPVPFKTQTTQKQFGSQSTTTTQTNQARTESQIRTEIDYLSQLVKDASLSLFFGTKKINLESLFIYRQQSREHAKRYQCRSKTLNILAIQVFTFNFVSFLVLAIFAFDPLSVNSIITLFHDLTLISLNIVKYRMCHTLRTKVWSRARQIEATLLTIRVNSIFSLVMEDIDINSDDQTNDQLTNSTRVRSTKEEQIKYRRHFGYSILYLVNTLCICYHVCQLYLIYRMILLINISKKSKHIIKQIQSGKVKNITFTTRTTISEPKSKFKLPKALKAQTRLHPLLSTKVRKQAPRLAVLDKLIKKPNIVVLAKEKLKPKIEARPNDQLKRN